jgi:DNA-binding MarR family transcriptional regulator
MTIIMSSAAPSPDALYAIIVEVRRLFHRLANATDALHFDLGVSAAQRAVLEALASAGATTVPALARRKGVTRQHIQVLANQLRALGLVEDRPNPDHKRSSLLELSAAGRRAFETIRARERRVLTAVGSKLARRSLGEVLAVLSDLGDLVEELAPPHPTADGAGSGAPGRGRARRRQGR